MSNQNLAVFSFLFSSKYEHGQRLKQNTFDVTQRLLLKFQYIKQSYFFPSCRLASVKQEKKYYVGTWKRSMLTYSSRIIFYNTCGKRISIVNNPLMRLSKYSVNVGKREQIKERVSFYVLNHLPFDNKIFVFRIPIKV